jgi:hypothetical protein
MLIEALSFSLLFFSNAGNLRPACSAETRGLMWPAQANADARLAVKLSRTGDLQICLKGPWKYHWHSPAIHWQDLRKDKTKRGG